MARPTLVLIDGSGYLYRAFHALPPLTNRLGEPTGALFGVFNMLRLELKTNPDHIAFVVDAPGKTFRDELYAEYKAHRTPMPDDLKAQVAPMLDLVAAMGFPILRIDGIEADDVIGTLALQAAAAGMDVTVSTGDKDLAQLVGPHVTLVNTMTHSRLDPAGVVEKFGVRPDQIIDYLALVGDSVDNIPGVEKCGPKTAAKWLGEYGTLDAVIANADKVGGKIGENLRAALPQLPLSRQLATIKTDCALDVAPAQLTLRTPDDALLRAFYQRYEFKAALRDMDAAAGTAEPGSGSAPTAAAALAGPTQEIAPPAPVETHYAQVTDALQFDAWLARLRQAELFAFDVIADGADPMRAQIVGIACAVAPGEAAYVPFAHDFPGAPAQLDRDHVLAALKPLLEDAQRAKAGHHAKFWLNLLACHGIEVRGLRFDAMLESYVFNASGNRHDLDTLAKKYLGLEALTLESVIGKGAKQIPFAQLDLARATEYSAAQADLALRLHLSLWPRLAADAALRDVFERIEMPLVPVLARMEQAGVLIDTAALRTQSQDLGRRLLELQQRAFDLAGRHFSLDSPKQLQQLLYDELKLPVLFKTPSGQPSTNEEALEALTEQHELPRLILDYRALAKLRSTYTDKLAEHVNPRTGRVHTSYHQAVAATGRLSSNEPNLQNIPIRTEEGRRIRQTFVAPPGHRILAADYSQIELRIMAHLSGDAGLLAAFHGNQDVHRATAAEVFGLPPEQVDANQRRAAKAINFGLMYGMSAFGLARNLGIERGQAGEYMKRYFERYPGVQAFMNATREQAHRDGYVQTLFGRRLTLPDINARNAALRAGAERAAINAPMQGTAADIIKRAMIAVDAWLATRLGAARMIMQVHDELVFEVHENAIAEVSAGVREHMMAAAQLDVPLIVDVGVGENWDEAH